MSDLDKLKEWAHAMKGLGLDLGEAGNSLKVMGELFGKSKPKLVTAAPPTSGPIKLADLQAALGDAPTELDAYFKGGPYVPDTPKMTAYEVALANGYHGNKAQWLASMYGGTVTHDSLLIEHSHPQYGKSMVADALDNLILYGSDPGADEKQTVGPIKTLHKGEGPKGFFQVHLDSVPTDWVFWKHEPATSSFGHPKDHTSGPDGDHAKGHHEYTPVKVKHQPGKASTRCLIPADGVDEASWGKHAFHHWELMADGRIYAVYGKQDGPRRRLPDQQAEALRELVMTGDVLEYAP